MDRMKIAFDWFKKMDRKENVEVGESLESESKERIEIWDDLTKNLNLECKNKGSSMNLIEELRKRDNGRESENSFYEDENDECYLDKRKESQAIEIINEEEIEESKHASSPKKKIKAKNENRKAIELVKAIKAKEIKSNSISEIQSLTHHQSLNSPDSNQLHIFGSMLIF